MPNPFLEAESTFNSNQKQNASLLQPVELGGKRTARINAGKSENAISELEDQFVLTEVAAGIARALARDRQFKIRLDLMEETKLSLHSLMKKLRSKAVRTPEERNAISIFSLQGTLIETQILTARQELKEVQIQLESTIGRKLTNQDLLVSAEVKNWPAPPKVSDSHTFEAKFATLKAQKAASEWHIQKSYSWPSLALGPTFERDGSKGETGWGAKIELSLPIFNINGGAQERTKAEFQRSELLSKQIGFKETENLLASIEQYNELASFLKESPSQASIRKSVAESLQLFGRGMIQPVAVVESYRTAVETLEAVQEKELAAFTLYWRLHSFSGEIPKEFL